MPAHLRNAPTRLMKALGHGAEYRYAHDEEGAFAAGESYWPEGKAPRAYYQPVPRGLEARNNLGNALQELGEYEQATACYRQALELRADDPEIHCNLGNVLRRLGRLEEAVACAQRAVALEPLGPLAPVPGLTPVVPVAPVEPLGYQKAGAIFLPSSSV